MIELLPTWKELVAGNQKAANKLAAAYEALGDTVAAQVALSFVRRMPTPDGKWIRIHMGGPSIYAARLSLFDGNDYLAHLSCDFDGEPMEAACRAAKGAWYYLTESPG